MPEVVSSVEEVFRTPEFDDVYRERLEALYQLHINREKLAEALTEFYQSPDRSEHEVDYMVSGATEYNSGNLAQIFGQDSVIAIYGRLADSALTQLAGIEGHLQEVGKEQGLSQFALLGLWRHTRSEDIPQRAQTKEDVKTTEEELLGFDGFVRKNAGRPLTYLNRTGVYGAILGEGGITVTEHRMLDVPVAEDSTVYAMSFIERDTELHQQPHLRVDPTDILAFEPTYFDSWTPLLRFPRGRMMDRTIFAAGEITEGSIDLPPDSGDADAEFYQRTFERIRLVGRQAAGATSET